MLEAVRVQAALDGERVGHGSLQQEGVGVQEVDQGGRGQPQVPPEDVQDRHGRRVVATYPLGENNYRSIGLVWRRSSPRRDEFETLGEFLIAEHRRLTASSELEAPARRQAPTR